MLMSLVSLALELKSCTNRCTSTCKQANTHPLNGLNNRILGQAIIRDILGLQALIAVSPTGGTTENNTSDATGSNQN
jgi:hypothetical protein